MPKILAILILTLTLTLVGCNRPQVDELQSDSATDQSQPQTGTIEQTPMSEAPKVVTAKEYKKLSEQQDQAIAELDPAKCEQIDNSNFKESCKIGVIYAEAQQKKDPSLCAKLGSPTDKVSCERSSQL
jgi:hypothetical protein